MSCGFRFYQLCESILTGTDTYSTKKNVMVGVRFSATSACAHMPESELLVERQNGTHSPGPVTGKMALALTRDVNLATQSSATSANRGGRSYP